MVGKCGVFGFVEQRFLFVVRGFFLGFFKLGVEGVKLVGEGLVVGFDGF